MTPDEVIRDQPYLKAWIFVLQPLHCLLLDKNHSPPLVYVDLSNLLRVDGFYAKDGFFAISLQYRMHENSEVLMEYAGYGRSPELKVEPSSSVKEQLDNLIGAWHDCKLAKGLICEGNS